MNRLSKLTQDCPSNDSEHLMAVVASALRGGRNAASA